MPDSLYCRNEHCDQETLEADLIVMNTENFEVVTLNATGQALWEALSEPVDIEDIASAFVQAFPGIESAVLRTDIERTLRTLLDSGLVVAEEPSGRS